MSQQILIVDDEPGIRLLLADVLTGEGYTVITAATGQEAINELRTSTFDLMIIDYKLPVLDGIEVLERTAEWKLDMPVILMSGLVENLVEEIKDCPQVKKLMAKPFNIFEFRDAVKTYTLISHL